MLFLDNQKSTLQQINSRTEYYKIMIQSTLRALGVDIAKLTFVTGSSYQLTPEYTLDVYKANSFITVHSAQNAGTEVVKQSDNPTMNSLLYPTLQALDEKYLDVDIQLGGVDQRKIFIHARENMPKLGYRKIVHLMNFMVPALSKVEGSANSKMSSSDNVSKIDMLDEPNVVKKKIGQAYCLEGNIDDNTPLIWVKRVLFPLLSLQNKDFLIERPDKFGGNIIFKSYEQVETDFANKKLHPADLKKGITDNLNSILDPVRKEFAKPEMQELLKKAYS